MSYYDFSELNEPDSRMPHSIANIAMQAAKERFDVRKCGKAETEVDYRDLARAAIARVSETRTVKRSRLNF